MPPPLAVATCAAAPDLDDDADVLRGGLRDLGVRHVVHAWDDPSVDWAEFDRVLVRSTWDYPRRRDQFLAWAESCPRTVNPADVLRWNTDKRYLLDLERAGVPVVPTRLLPVGDTGRPAWTDVVVKPAVSGAAADTGRFPSAVDRDAQLHIESLHRAGRDVLVQPYTHGIDTHGETSLVYLGDRLSHAVSRRPLLDRVGVRTPVGVADVLPTTRAVTPSRQQVALAERALAAVPGGRGRLSYARVDLVPTADGPAVLELELTDCFLFLGFAAPAAVRSMPAPFASGS
ncbi:ATP-grasp domain-containing protein [Phycicoccus flavus]|uniref:ATP-grasp domain-containing protein n=1 Tax=Phycicoccus flavus TaxID=2502783 RepID=UPI000FEBB4E8|nr:hypothetical protein [Phycicoccus flavus]NHA70278.1 hypothetical protein [Phycicoccus flavus]